MTLNDLLKPDFKKAKRIGWQAAETEETIQHIRQVLEAEIQGLNWQTVKQEIYYQLETLLDIPLHDVLVRAWLTSKVVANAIEKQKLNPSDAVAVIPLLPHKVRSKHQPKLQVHLNNNEVGELPLLAMYTFRLSGVLLKIQHGKIQTILAGKCKSFASLLYQDTMLKEQKVQSFDLLNYANFVPPVPEDIATETQSPLEATADDIHTETRHIDGTMKAVELTSEEIVEVKSPLSFAKKLFFIMIGLSISLLMLAAMMLFFS
jgi:hypothetical protein